MCHIELEAIFPSVFINIVQFWKKNVRKYFGLEPVMFLYSVAYFSSFVSIQNFYIDRICRISLNLTAGVCNNLSKYPVEEKSVEMLASKFTMYQSIIETGVPVVTALYLSSLGDRFQKKKSILLAITGYTLSSGLYLLLSTYILLDAVPELLLLSSVPVAISGGMIVSTIFSSSLMASETPLETRSFRMTVLGHVWNIGEPIGLIFGSKLFKMTSFTVVFSTASVLYGSSVVYGHFMIPNQMPNRLTNRNENYDCGARSTELLNEGHSCICNVDSLKNTLMTTFKQRTGNKRRKILLLTGLLCLHYLTFYGTYYYRFLYTRNNFGWDVETYSQFSAIHSLIGIVGGIVTIAVTMKLFILEDASIGIICCFSNMLSYFIIAFASAPWMMYCGSVVAMFGVLMTYVIRSMLSKLVDKDELNNLFCFATCVELSIPFIGSVLYNSVYQNTLLYFPGAIYFMSSGLQFLILLCFVLMSRCQNDASHQEYILLPDTDVN